MQTILAAVATQTGIKISMESNDPNVPDLVPEQNLTVHLKGITAASALDLVARDVGWNWYVDQGGVVVTDDDQLPVVAQIYDVHDLVLAHPGGGGADDELLDYDYSSLADVITGAIPAGWSNDDAALLQDCSPFHGTLTIIQDSRVQDEVEGLLAALRKARDLRPGQFDATASAGFDIRGGENQSVQQALAKSVTTEPTAANLDDLAAWIRATYAIPVHINWQARKAGVPGTALAAEPAEAAPLAFARRLAKASRQAASPAVPSTSPFRKLAAPSTAAATSATGVVGLPLSRASTCCWPIRNSRWPFATKPCCSSPRTRKNRC